MTSQASVSNSLQLLYRHHQNWLRNFLVRRTHCTELAADLAQDTFLRLLIRQQDFQAIEQPRAFLSKVALGLVAHHWRRRDVEQAYLDALASLAPEDVPSPEQQQLVLEALLQLDQMLQTLPTKVRTAFLLARLEGWQYGAIARELGVSERMIKKYIAQAMLQALLWQQEQVA